jgi:ribulose-phosphate 3-epimerase
MSRVLPDGPLIAPSILSADFGALRSQVAEVLDAGARVVHVDVMDGHFVPPLTIGPAVLASIAALLDEYGALADVHLMVERPERHVQAFAKAGADLITFHAEATPDLALCAGRIRDAGCMAGVAINPGTPVAAVAQMAAHVDLVLCMTVSPGWGGQQFLPGSTEKVADLAALVAGRAAIEVDGGIDAATAPGCRRAGARLFVAGSAIFGRPDPAAAYAELGAAVAGAGA